MTLPAPDTQACGEQFRWEMPPGFGVLVICDATEEHPMHAGRVVAMRGYSLDLTGLIVAWSASAPRPKGDGDG